VAYTSEIEKLERRWLENPKGRNFAPLADAYRKAGELDRAIELCKSGLELHPDYVSAHIVYGRCLIDQKNDSGAVEVFQKVLSLDPENILALKVLAEIAERLGRFDEGVQWLGRLIAADPMNGDAAEALTRLKGKAAQAASAAAPVAQLVPPPAGETPEPGVIGLEPTSVGGDDFPTVRPSLINAPTMPMAQPEFEVERASGSHVTPELGAVGSGGGDLETFDGTMDLKGTAAEAAQADGIELASETSLSPENVQVEGLARTHYEGSGMFTVSDAPPEAEPTAPADESDDGPSVDLPLIMPDDISSEPAPHRAPPRAEPPPPPRISIPAAVALSDDDGAADTAALSRAEPVLTETMAELYLQQGHREDAVRVYQALLAQRPGDDRLAAKLAVLEGRAPAPTPPARPAPPPVRSAPAPSGQSVGSFLKRILGAKPGAAAPEPLPPARPSHPVPVPARVPEPPSTLAAAFGDTAESDPPAVPPPGAPSRPASDSISLDSVFGEETPRASRAEAAPAPAPRQTAGGFSFDEFFGASNPAPAGGADTRGDAPAPKTHRPTRSSRPNTPPEEPKDLDQFQSWLKGLKS